jgi:hypothetical protein
MTSEVTTRRPVLATSSPWPIGDVKGAARCHRAVGHRHAERLALEQLADGVVDAVRLADVEEREDVGM